MRRLRFLRAPFSYFGGKSTILREIFRWLPSPAARGTFVDAFTGGGSVALFAKAKGYRVLTNDLATRSYLVGQAFIVNDGVRLAPADIARLHVDRENDGRIERSFAPTWFLPEHARWLDNAFAAVAGVEHPVKQALLTVILVHAIFRLRPYDTFSRPAMPDRLETVREHGSKLHPEKVRWLLTRSPRRLTDGLLERVNAGVFSNGHQNEAHHKDVLAFLPAVRGDIAYFDPPYWGSNSYERLYSVLDEILEGAPRQVSRFNQSGAEQLLHDMLEASTHIPFWAISFGGGKLTPEAFLDLVQKHRPAARLVPIRHRYRFGSAHRRERQDEILVLAAAAGHEALLP